MEIARTVLRGVLRLHEIADFVEQRARIDEELG